MKTRRVIGPRMKQAVAIVAENPGTRILPVAQAIAPYGKGIQFGYRAVHRAIKAGLINAVRHDNGRYSLTVAG